jgi:hypothetical protein
VQLAIPTKVYAELHSPQFGWHQRGVESSSSARTHGEMLMPHIEWSWIVI